MQTQYRFSTSVDCLQYGYPYLCLVFNWEQSLFYLNQRFKTTNMQKSVSLLAAFILLFSFVASAQNNGTVKGFVYDKKSGEPIINANITVVDAKTGVQSDVNGYFSLTLPSGSYTILATNIGYDSSIMTINLLPGSVLTKKITLGRADVELKGVEVSGRKTERITRINTGVSNITPKELKLLPSAGGEPDLAQYLQVIPGVVFTGDQGGQLYIRGGSTAQTGIYLDGVTIYNPFHSIGLFSVFETEAIRSVDVHTGGFPAQYGNRTSAIVDVHTKDGNKNNLAGLVSVSPIMSRILLEGPIAKSKKDDGSSITFLVTGKTSYLNQTSKTLYSSLGPEFKNGLPYSFTDLYSKVTFNGGNGSKLNLFGFNFNDNASLVDAATNQNQGNFHWVESGGGVTFVVSPGSSAALLDGKFAYSNYDMTLNPAGGYVDTLPRNSSIGGFEAAINFTYFLPNYSQLKYGVEVSGLNTSLSYYSALGISTALDRQSTMAGLYFMYRKNFSSRFILEPSVRLQYYSELNKLSPEPRLGIKYNITDAVRFKAAAGVYSQNIIGTKSDQDIVNLFTGFMLTPDRQIRDADSNLVKSNLQTAYHLITGFEVDINKVELNVEPWVKYFGQVDELNRNKLYASQADFIAATGLAYGVDLSGKYSYDRVYLWAAVGTQNVTYTSIDAKGKKQTYPTPFDTRFNANIVASYTAGCKKDWDLSVRWNVHSPFPFTQTQGFYQNPVVNLTNNIVQQNGSVGVRYADEINGGRLSWYYRMDISVRKRFVLTKKSNLDAIFAVTNVTDRQNIFYVNRVTNQKIYQLPLFPALNLTWTF
jgi:hypothetical protein